jgi:hypothetical protein
MADPVAWPVCSPICGIDGASQTCSGSIPPGEAMRAIASMSGSGSRPQAIS